MESNKILKKIAAVMCTGVAFFSPISLTGCSSDDLQNKAKDLV